MNHTQQFPLESEDILIIRKRRNVPIYIIVAISSVINFFFLFFVKDEIISILIAISLFDLLLIIPILIIINRGVKDEKKGIKYIIKGVVTEKYVTGNKSRILYISIGNEKFVATNSEYKRIAVGDTIEAHITAHTRTTIRVFNNSSA